MANRERANALSRASHAANRERANAYNRAWRAANREQIQQKRDNEVVAYELLKQQGMSLDHVPAGKKRQRVAYKVLKQHFPGVLPPEGGTPMPE